jgi:biotin carboxyl carrier protein
MCSLSFAEGVPGKILSPTHTFIGDVFVKPGKSVSMGEPILMLDTLELENELARYRAKAEIARILAERFSDNYLNEFEFCSDQSLVPASIASCDQLKFLSVSHDCPKDQLVNIRKQAETLQEERHRFLVDNFNVGRATHWDVTRSMKAIDQRGAMRFEAEDTRKKDVAEILKDREKTKAEIVSFETRAEIVENQIKLANIVAPKGGTVRLYVVPGIFVERGDPLFDIN